MDKLEQIIICPICKEGAMVRDWRDKNFIECIVCEHTVKIS